VNNVDARFRAPSVRAVLLSIGLLAPVLLALSDSLPAAKPDCPHSPQREKCHICQPALREPGRLWCNEHGRYEDRCFECHPDQRDPKRAYCNEHSLYEDECQLCRPDVEPKPSPDSTPARLMCDDHRVPEDECGICHPELLRTVEPGRSLKVRLASPGSAEKAGVTTALPRLAPMADAVECYAEIKLDENRLAQVVAPVSGVLRNVEADLGDQVGERSRLATLVSPQVAEMAAQARVAWRAVGRERQLYAERVSAQRDLEEAEAAYLAASEQLRGLGLDDVELDSLLRSPAAPVLTLRSPFAGEIVERHAVTGSMVEQGAMLFTVADRSRVWAMLSIPEPQLGRVRVGQQVEVRSEAMPDRDFVGRLTWLSPQVDSRTRLGTARAELTNTGRLLRGGMFVRARIVTASRGASVVVPRSAIQQLDGRACAFVRLADDLYEVRPLRLGAKTPGEVEVHSGLEVDDLVVVSGGFAVKSQLLISRLGAGCVDE